MVLTIPLEAVAVKGDLAYILAGPVFQWTMSPKLPRARERLGGHVARFLDLVPLSILEPVLATCEAAFMAAHLEVAHGALDVSKRGSFAMLVCNTRTRLRIATLRWPPTTSPSAVRSDDTSAYVGATRIRPSCEPRPVMCPRGVVEGPPQQEVVHGAVRLRRPGGNGLGGSLGGEGSKLGREEFAVKEGVAGERLSWWQVEAEENGRGTVGVGDRDIGAVVRAVGSVGTLAEGRADRASGIDHGHRLVVGRALSCPTQQLARNILEQILRSISRTPLSTQGSAHPCRGRRCIGQHHRRDRQPSDALHAASVKRKSAQHATGSHAQRAPLRPASLPIPQVFVESQTGNRDQQKPGTDVLHALRFVLSSIP